MDPLLLDNNFLIESFKEDLLLLPSSRDVKCPEKTLLLVWWARKEFQIATLAGIVDTNFGGLTYKHLMAKLPEHVDLEMHKYGFEIGLGQTPTVGQWPLVLSKLDFICEFYRTQVSWSNVTFNSLKKTYPRIEKGASSLSLSKVKVNAISTGSGGRTSQPKPPCFVCGDPHFWVFQR